MVKKILFFSTLMLITIIPSINVNALSFPSPTSFQLQNYDGTSNSYSVRTVGWYNVNSYGANINYGGTYGVSNQDITRWNIWYSNSNICLNKNATLYITINSYYSPFNTSQSPIMTYTSFLRAYNGTTDYTCSLNQSLNEGKTTTWTCNIIGTQNLLLHLETDMPSDTVYGFSVGTDSNYVCDTTADVSSSINNSTQNIINNQNQNKQDIINNQNQNTQDIIDNQNSNTDKEIESQKVCQDLYYDKSNSVETSTYYLDNNGNLVRDNLYAVSKYIKLNKGNTYIINQIGSLSNLPSYCLYNEDKTLIGCTSYSGNRSLTIIPNSNSYIRFSIFNSGSSDVSLSGSFCQNGNQALNDSVNSLNDTLNSEQDPNTNQDINDMNDMVASYTPISDLITMPLTLINAYINGINSSCSSVNLGNLYGTDLILPCINLESRLGSNLWSIIDTFFCIFMCYNIGMLFVTAFDGITSLRDDFEGLYQPRHADVGYQPKHGGGN